MKNVMRHHLHDAFLLQNGFYHMYTNTEYICAYHRCINSDAHIFFLQFNFSTPLYRLLHMVGRYVYFCFLQIFVLFRIVFFFCCLVGQQPNLMMLCCERTHSQKLCNPVLEKLCLMAYVRLKRCENLHNTHT